MKRHAAKDIETSVHPSQSFLLGEMLAEGTQALLPIVAADGDTHSLRIGENHHSKPILDRAMRRDPTSAEAIEIGLLSFDAAINSHVGVVRPVDVVTEAQELQQLADPRRVAAAYASCWKAVQDGQAEAIRKAFAGLALPTWQREDDD